VTVRWTGRSLTESGNWLRLSRSTWRTRRSEILSSCDIVLASPSFSFCICNNGTIIGWYPCSSWAIFFHSCHRIYSFCLSERLLPSPEHISVFMTWTRVTWGLFRACCCRIRRVYFPQPFEHNWVLLCNVWLQCVIQSAVSLWKITMLKNVLPHVSVKCLSKTEHLKTTYKIAPLYRTYGP